MPELTAELARELLSYDPDTGIFTWKGSSRGHAKGAIAGCCSCYGYILIHVHSRMYRAHRLAWFITHGSWPENQIDHINGVKHDNRLLNLRDVTPTKNSENLHLARPGSRSGLLGAHWDRNNKKFVARIVVKKKPMYLGRYATAEEAHQAYLSAKRLLHDGFTP